MSSFREGLDLPYRVSIAIIKKKTKNLNFSLKLQSSQFLLANSYRSSYNHPRVDLGIEKKKKTRTCARFRESLHHEFLLYASIISDGCRSSRRNLPKVEDAFPIDPLFHEGARVLARPRHTHVRDVRERRRGEGERTGKKRVPRSA